MRPEGWERRLSEEVERARRAMFSRSGLDCAAFAIRCIRAVSGNRRAATGYLSRYRSSVAARRVLEEGGGWRGICGDVLGDEVDPRSARRGDLVLLPGGEEDTDEETVGVCLGRRCAVMGPAGLAFVPRSQAITAWRVG